jgi:hypothetical protein
MRVALSRNYVLKYVGEMTLSGLLMFSAASLFRTRHSLLFSAWEATFLKPLTLRAWMLKLDAFCSCFNQYATLFSLSFRSFRAYLDSESESILNYF